MLLGIYKSKAYTKALEKYVRSGDLVREQIDTVLEMLAQGKQLDVKYRDHALGGKYMGTRECHIRPNILLLYKIEKDRLLLILLNLGSHSDFF